MIKEISSEPKLILNCPLETLFCNWEIRQINFQHARKLKRLICFGWPAMVFSDGKFECLEYLNLFTEKDKRVSDHLLDLMPKLKRLVLYSQDPQADLESTREQQKRFGLSQLEILFWSGFSEPLELTLESEGTALVILNQWTSCSTTIRSWRRTRHGAM